MLHTQASKLHLINLPILPDDNHYWRVGNGLCHFLLLLLLLLLPSAVSERVAALTSSTSLNPELVRRLYTTIPGLMCFMTLEVAQKLRGLAWALGFSMQTTVGCVLQNPRLVFLHPDTLETRLGLLARWTGSSRRAAVAMLLQQPQLLLCNSQQLATR